MPHVRGTYAEGETYVFLDIVALNGCSFIARADNPGACPGDAWQLIASAGKSGRPGPKGDAGERGERGLTGPAGRSIASWKLDAKGYVITPVMSDGTEGPSLKMRGLFEQYNKETDLG